MSQEHSFSLPHEAFDLDLIGLSPADVGSAAFSEKVSAFFAREFANFGGRARGILNDSNRTIEVNWTKDRGFKEPKDHAMELLQSGKVAKAIPLLWTLHQESLTTQTPCTTWASPTVSWANYRKPL